MSKNYLTKLRDIFLENSTRVSELEMISGNYDDKGDLIKEDIPTLITEFCEIGIYKNSVYFVFIVFSNTYNKNLFDLLKKFPNIQFYGFKDFKNNLYPKANFDYEQLEKELRKDKHFQIQFNYYINKTTLNDLYQGYIKIRDIFKENKIKVVNQL